jgi:hypothetical protein
VRKQAVAARIGSESCKGSELRSPLLAFLSLSLCAVSIRFEALRGSYLAPGRLAQRADAHDRGVPDEARDAIGHAAALVVAAPAVDREVAPGEGRGGAGAGAD